MEVEGQHFVKIRGDEKHPLSTGYICQKAARLDHYQNNDDRIGHPLRRRADGTFEQISWEVAVREIAAKMIELRTAHGGECFAFYGGGGQGNHLGAPYAMGMLSAMGSRYLYSALAQEKTGDFWVNGKLFGRQTCHITEDIEHADYVLFIGTNPWQAHGIRNAREAVRELGKSSERKMAVIDPRRTETAELADVHLQIRPGTDAFLLSAMLAIMVRDRFVDETFIRERTTGFSELKARLEKIPIAEFVSRAGVELADVERVVREFCSAKAACVRIDLGLQQSLHSTLNSYLEKLLFLLTGNFGKKGGNNLHTLFIPLIGHSDEGKKNKPTVVSGQAAIGKLYPPNILPAEIDSEHPKRVRALFVDSANPMMSAADTQAYAKAFAKLELMVVVDVALTETARAAHYVLPAASQFEKWEATGFNLDFPKNYFHLRAPIFPAHEECLPEAEIYCRILEAMGEMPRSFPVLEKIAAVDRKLPPVGVFAAASLAYLGLNPKLRKYGAHILYRTLGKVLPEQAAAAAPLWVLSQGYARKHKKAVRKAGHRGLGPLSLGEDLFRAILGSRSGVMLSDNEYEDTWSFLRYPDKKIHFDIPEMLEWIGRLESEVEVSGDYPFVLIAGERRAYNANTIFRDPAWRKKDGNGALSIHPSDAASLGLANGDRARCTSARGELEVVVETSDRLRPGVVSLPHGYGMSYRDSGPIGPSLNRLTSSSHRDPIAATPFHKYVPVRISRA